MFIIVYFTSKINEINEINKIIEINIRITYLYLGGIHFGI